DSLASIARRVSSPSAAKANACASRGDPRLCRLLDMLRDVLHLLAPAAIVHAERLEPALFWNPVEAGLDDAQQGPGGVLLQRELDQCRRLGRVIPVRIDRVGMPSEREQTLGFDLLHNHLHAQVLGSEILERPAPCTRCDAEAV